MDFGSPDLLQPTPATPPAAKPAPKLRPFGDVDATRSAIYDRVFSAASTLPPVTNQRHTLKLSNVKWADPGQFSKRQRKDAVLGGRTLGRRLRGTWELSDNATGNVLDTRRDAVVATVPHLTEGGTFVIDGSEYAVRNQQRLKAGVFTRRKDNGEVESHANILSGGPSHHYWLDPEKGVFNVRL